ncbi:MAG TPA: hypothetical protein VMT75_01380 [Candidatus Saccharimonadales bacterium]|nr:hypothetical protein [Candidatus Saccharimonadales bacterium]
MRRAVRSRYVAMLEEEVTRLRAENRAMLNSLLGTAGLPPVEIGDGRMAEVPRLRRRSWQQIQRFREEGASRPPTADR